MEQSNVIEIQNLTKRFGASKAVNNISFDVRHGEILGFLGPNGAGKSTTMNILTGYISSSSGSVKVCGHSILEEPNEVKKKIGYLPEQPPLYFDMTVLEYLNFVYDLKKASENRKAHLEEIMKTVGIDKVKGRLIKNLSKGYKQRVGLAQALVGNPEVLVLDEPTVGLDPRQIIEIRNVIKALGKKRTIILSTHILQEVTAVCDRVVIINRGQIVKADTLENLSGKASSGRYTLRLAADEYKVKNALSEVANVKYSDILGVREKDTVDILVEAAEFADIRTDLFNAFAQKQIPILMFKPMEMTLEEIFISATSETVADTEDIKPVPKNLSDELKKIFMAKKKPENTKAEPEINKAGSNEAAPENEEKEDKE